MTSPRRIWIVAASLAAVVAVAGAVWFAVPRPSAPEAAPSGGLAASGAPGPAASGSPSPAPTSTPADASLRLAVIGDSISAGVRPVDGPEDLEELSWIHWAQHDGLDFVGGWAVPGAVTAQMAEHATPMDADVLVIMAGTNDVAWGVGFDESAANIRRIVDTVGVDRVVLAAIPPNDYGGGFVTLFNERLAAFAAENGWEYADAAASLRTPDDTFVSGTTIDGVHPTVEAARVLGEAVRAHVVGD